MRQAGLKGKAKRTALKAGVSVTPGIDNGTLTLLKKHSDHALMALVTEHGLELEDEISSMTWTRWPKVLTASYRGQTSTPSTNSARR